MAVEIHFLNEDTHRPEAVTNLNGLPVNGTVTINSLSQDLAHKIAISGRKFYASDADENDKVTGATSFSLTTPTFLLRNPADSGVVCIPLFFTLNQSGTVAGGAVDIIAFLDVSDRWSSGGTNERVISARPKSGTKNKCQLRTGATATTPADTTGIRMDGITTGQDVSPAEGALQQYLWTPTSVMDLLDPGTSMLIYTYADTTGPTWWWSFSWAEVPPEWLGSV